MKYEIMLCTHGWNSIEIKQSVEIECNDDKELLTRVREFEDRWEIDKSTYTVDPFIQFREVKPNA